jgi:hypothetical protein
MRNGQLVLASLTNPGKQSVKFYDNGNDHSLFLVAQTPDLLG